MLWSKDQPERARWHEVPRIIVVRLGLTDDETVSCLAHELGHWWHGDFCSTDAAERRAWRFAGALLIDPQEHMRAEMIHHAPGAIARELGVLRDVVEGYEDGLRVA